MLLVTKKLPSDRQKLIMFVQLHVGQSLQLQILHMLR